MGRDKGYIIRKLICGFFAFLISLLLFVELSFVIVQNTVLSESYMRNQLSKSDYYNKLADEIKEQWASYGSASGFEATFFDDIINVNQLTFDVNIIAKQLYKPDQKTEIDAVKIQTDLYDRFLKYAQDKGVEVTPEIQEALQLLATTCVESYMDYVNIPYLSQLETYLGLLQKPVKIVFLILPVLILLLGIVIFFLNQWKHRALRYYIYALSGAALMLVGVPLICYISGKIGKVAITFTSLYDFAVSYLYGILMYFWIAAAILIVISSVLSIPYSKIKRSALNW